MTAQPPLPGDFLQLCCARRGVRPGERAGPAAPGCLGGGGDPFLDGQARARACAAFWAGWARHRR